MKDTFRPTSKTLRERPHPSARREINPGSSTDRKIITSRCVTPLVQPVCSEAGTTRAQVHRVEALLFSSDPRTARKIFLILATRSVTSKHSLSERDFT